MLDAVLRPALFAWIAILAVGVGLIHERFDWDIEGGRFAERAFVLSAYLFVILLPTCFYLARRLLRSDGAAAAVTGVLFVITTTPYELLGLSDLRYYADHPRFYWEGIAPALEFFPEGTLRAFPWDWLFMPLLFLTGAGVIWGVWALRGRAGAGGGRLVPALLTVAFAAICIQAFLHSSMRAPYTYLAHFQFEEAVQHWYHVYNFADGSGASQGDHFAFWGIEDYFQAAPYDADNQLIRRPFSFYLAAQASYFFNTYYAWLALNCLSWLAAVLAIGRLVTRWATPRAGAIAAALTAVGPGFVAFAATPAMYMQSYAAVAVALLLFEDLVVRPAARDPGRLALFTGATALCLLVYDLTPLLLVLLAYGLARRLPFWRLAATLVAAFAIARGFTWIVTGPLGIEINPYNAEQLTEALTAFKDFLLDPSVGRWSEEFVTITSSFVGMLLQAFFVLPVLVALFGIGRLRDPALRVLVAGLVLMTYATIFVLQVGDQGIGTVPRLVYACFPAIYLLAALALDRDPLPSRVASARARRLSPALGAAAPWVVVGGMAVLVNLDIFGHITQYVEFFVGDPPVFLPD